MSRFRRRNFHVTTITLLPTPSVHGGVPMAPKGECSILHGSADRVLALFADGVHA